MSLKTEGCQSVSPSDLTIANLQGKRYLVLPTDSRCQVSEILPATVPLKVTLFLSLQHVRKIDVSPTSRTIERHGDVRLFVRGDFRHSFANTALLMIWGDSVPAEYASFRLHDALLSRLSNDGVLFYNLFIPSRDIKP